MTLYQQRLHPCFVFMLFLTEPILSAYFCASSEAQPGLSIWPERLATAQHRVAVAGAHEC